MPSGTLLAMALLCPASAINVIDGQVVFLVAALIVGGLGLLDSRPVLGGLGRPSEDPSQERSGGVRG